MSGTAEFWDLKSINSFSEPIRPKSCCSCMAASLPALVGIAAGVPLESFARPARLYQPHKKARPRRPSGPQLPALNMRGPEHPNVEGCPPRTHDVRSSVTCWNRSTEQGWQPTLAAASSSYACSSEFDVRTLCRIGLCHRTGLRGAEKRGTKKVQVGMAGQNKSGPT